MMDEDERIRRDVVDALERLTGAVTDARAQLKRVGLADWAAGRALDDAAASAAAAARVALQDLDDAEPDPAAPALRAASYVSYRHLGGTTHAAPPELAGRADAALAPTAPFRGTSNPLWDHRGAEQVCDDAAKPPRLAKLRARALAETAGRDTTSRRELVEVWRKAGHEAAQKSWAQVRGWERGLDLPEYVAPAPTAPPAPAPARGNAGARARSKAGMARRRENWEHVISRGRGLLREALDENRALD